MGGDERDITVTGYILDVRIVDGIPILRKIGMGRYFTPDGIFSPQEAMGQFRNCTNSF